MRMILLKKETTIIPGLSETLTHFEAWKFYNLIGMGMMLRNIMFRDMTDVDDDDADDAVVDHNNADDDYDDDADDDHDDDDNDDCPGT